MAQTFDRFNKLIGELATVGVKMDQDDINRKFLRSLGDEWTMYTVSYRQSDNLEEKELDDIYNDLRVFETEVEIKKKPTGYVHNAALLSASTDTTAIPEAVSTASGASSEKGTETIFEAFLSSHSNNSLINDDLDQLHPDDLEEMDIKWQMAMLSIRVKKFIKRTGRNNFSQRREDGAGFDKTKNQALMAEVSDLPSEVTSNLCTKSCIDTVKRYRDHNQSMYDDLKRLEKDRRDYVLIVERFEEQIKGFQANELQHSYDTNYWKWEKNELETKLSKSLEESDKLKEELSKVKLDIEKFSYASKAMDSLLKAQIHDKMKPGIGYNSTPPPYNNNYISPTSDLLETKEKKDLSEKAFKIDPLDEVVIKDLTEKEASKNRDNDMSKKIPVENNIITNEGCGKIWVKSKEIEKTKGKDNKVHYKQTTVVNPGSCKQCTCSKAKSLNSGLKRGNQRNWNNQWAQKQGVDLSKINRPKPCFICGKVSAAESITAATCVSTAKNINAANTVSTSSKVNTANTVTAANTVTTANKVSTAKHASAAKAVSTSKTSTVSSTNVSKPIIVTKYSKNEELKFKNLGNQQLKGKSIWHVDSGCSRHMTGNMSCLQNFKHINGGHVAFGDNLTGGKISGKGNVTKGKMTFEDVYYVDQLKYNMLSVSQVCDKQHSILFTNTECMILAPGFKVVDESMILLRTPRKDNVYCLDMDNVDSDSSLNCLVSKASVDESSLWHRRMCHMNFKTMNKLVKNNLVRGLPSKVFSCDNHCVACIKGKQHKTSHKTKEINSISSCLQLLHMDLFGPTNVMSIGKKSYCLVIVDDYSRFTWVYFLRTKDETSGLIKSFILRIENHTNQKVKIIRSDNGTEFKNLDLNTFCEEKGIEKQYSAPRTPQQNGVAERRNRTLIEAARSLLADSKLSITFWAEAVNTACYVQNRVLVVKQKNKTPYELLNKRKPFIGFFKPFGCPCTILNTKTHLGKFDSKADDGFLVGYSSQSKAYRVFNSSSRIIEESDNVKCNENTPNPIGSGPQWLFDIDSLTNSFGFSSDDYAGSGCGGSGTTQVQETIPKSVIFPIPTVDSVEESDKEPTAGSSQSEEENRHKETQENKESEVVAENTSVELNDSNLEVGLNEEPSQNTRVQKNHWQEHPSSMASMAFIDEHNEIAMLQKPKQAAGFHQIVDFLKSSHIAHALTVAPTIYIEHQRQFWANATIVAENGVQMIKTRVCDQPLTVTEEVIRISLRLDDASGITSIPNDELFSSLTRMGYGGPLGVFKFSKAKFSPQWRFFVHTLMHCISKKTTGWSEFSSTIAYALVCLATARRYNFSQMIFSDLVSNMGNKKSFFMYHRFVQEVITHVLTDIPQPVGVYVPKPPKGKVFSNMRRSAGDSEGVDTPLFSTMMVVSQTNEGMAAGSRPPLDHPTASQSQPSHSKLIPQSLLEKPTSPITQTYKRKQVKKAPSLLVPSTPKPLSPLKENSPLGNIHRETTGVSPNPKEVLSEEEVEHMGDEAATTPASTEEESGNINKTSPMATLNEQSFKGPRCQETTGVDSASARQKTSTNKRSHDPSIGGNTHREGEDRYDYNELMETMGNINMDVIKQGKDIEELKLVILSQQVQITKLKKLVTRLLQKRRRKQFVLKRRASAQDASNKGENQENETEKESKPEMGFDVEGEIETEETEFAQAAETVNAVEVKEAAVTGLSVEELEIAETLVKAKNDTPKATQKAKGVVINEGEPQKEVLRDIKGKGKEKMVEEAELPTKKKSQIELDEAIAKQLQDQMEKEEMLQTETDRELARKMARKLNVEYQKNLKEAAQIKKLQAKKMPVMKQKRQPSKTFLANQERRKMINFLKGAIGVKGEMFTHMAYSQVEELYNKEMAKLQGDSAQREEAERRMKERHDLNIQMPFPEETTPSKEEAEEQKEEPESVDVEAKSGKRVKSIASKRQLKRPRVEETEKEAEPSVTSQTESVQLPEQSSKPKDERIDPYMTIVEPLKAYPISMQAPEIIFWDILRDSGKNFFRIKRADGSFEAYSTWGRVIRSCSRADMEELYKVGMKLYEPVLKGTEENLLKVTLEYLCMMFDPERVHYRIKDHNHEFIFKKIDKWILFENCGVYMITIDNCYHEYYLVDKIYEHSKEKLEGMLKATLLGGDCWELKKRSSMVNAAGSELLLLEDFKVSTAEYYYC
ncbi:hypothetical protein L6452_07690 [Arctium lappa]|uniref:Uncharacterized protein n=1 Tax=Arctium lappa TaxID=4217 RepID=A0ACB9EL89_ARCLA|nr:hypothetical protein L6452_07690 [Arctium lappa]